MNRGARGEPTPPESALAAEMFDHLCSAGTMKQILALHREICNTLNLKPNRLLDFYPKLKAKLACSWKAQALFKKFDARANHKIYGKGRSCAQTRVLIIGAGPCGLRAAIECQLLGAKVVVVEKRDRMSRNNVLHLWPFVIQDLRALGAKKFFGKFCAGSIDHISIRQLQCILMKVCLLLGVELHEGVSFEELLEPTVTADNETLGWRARVLPADHPVAQYEFDTLIGADGRRNTLHGFKRKEFRGKLAMAITANFINRHSEQEASVPEISGVAFIFNQKFFKDLYEETGIDLENIVYYKDDTHYFVMTAKKHSLLDKGVLLKDYSEVSRLLEVGNVDRGALMRYAQEAASFSTDGRLPHMDFALNHYGEPDVALFDFTSMYAAENASLVVERLGRRILCQLVGDSLLEPFWPTGSGCARGFLSALDAAWAVRAWGQAPPPHPLHVVAERESIYRLLAQTTPENLNRDFGGYTLDPGTRYPNLNRTAVTPHRVSGFYDSDDPIPLDAAIIGSNRKRRRDGEVPEEVLLAWVGCKTLREAAGPLGLTELLRRYRPDLMPPAGSPRTIYHVLHHNLGINPPSSGGSLREASEAKLRSYLIRVYNAFKGEVPHVHHQTDIFDQLKQHQQKEKHARNTTDHTLAMYSSAAETEKSHSSYKKKRRSVRSPQVSTEPDEYIRKKIGKLDLNEISQLARLIDGHDAVSGSLEHADKQKSLQEEIIALLDPEESPDPKLLRESLAQLLQGPSKTRCKVEPKPRAKRHIEEKPQRTLDKYFVQDVVEQPIRPPRKLKGLDLNSMKFPDLTDILGDDTDINTDAKFIQVEPPKPLKKKEFIRSSSTECHSQPKEKMKKSFRSNSVDSPEMAQGTKRIAELFDTDKFSHSPSPEPRSVRSGSTTITEKALRWQRMADIFEGKPRHSPSPNRAKREETIGNPEMILRRRKVAELIAGQKPQHSPSPDPTPVRRNSGEIAFKVQRVSDMMQKHKNVENKKKSGGRRKAAREIMKQRFERSIQMLAAEPKMDFASSADLENDYNLQQYRASAPQFDERVKKLEKKLQHYEEGRIVAGGGRNAGGSGARVARLAAELAGTTATTSNPKSSKPKDLMRSVGKIERDDWNVKEIERKIMENRLGRPEPKTAEKVPKWDREQFLGRQRRLKEGDNEEKWGEIDETLQKLDQKLRDSGRPDHGTKKVANLAIKFIKKENDADKQVQKEDCRKGWRGPPTAGMQCAACGKRVFAAESVTADGLHLHRSCFRCAVCRSVLRPGNYTMERTASRLVCLRHSGISVPDAVTAMTAASAHRIDAPTHTPERISLEASDHGAREIDEDEWTDRNFLASETSCAGGLSDEDESSSEEYTDANSDGEAELQGEAEVLETRPRGHTQVYYSDDSFGYDDYSDDGGDSSGNESCSRMRDAREARRREVPADNRPPTDSSEVESEEESESSSEDEVSSATAVSTDSEFARDECPPAPPPPAILVTEPPPPTAPLPPPPVGPPSPTPLSRTKSAGGLATKRALELKRKYLLGEPSPTAVRKSESTSQLDTKFEAFRSNITEFQKMLNPTHQSPKPVVASQFSSDNKKPMPDIIKNLYEDAPVDLLTKVVECNKDWREETPIDEKKTEPESELSDDSSHTQTGANQTVPRVEVHDEGGELIQLDSLMIANNSEDKDDRTTVSMTESTGATVVAAESEWSESCRDMTTLAMTETDLSDWAAESGVLEDYSATIEKSHKKRNKNPRTLSGPKSVHDAKNVSAIASHVCGRTSPEDLVKYSNALEHFQFADEGDQDPTLENPPTPKNEGYMELVDDDYSMYSPVNDRSMNFIERSFSETMVVPSLSRKIDTEFKKVERTSQIDEMVTSTDSESTITKMERPMMPEIKSPQSLMTIESSGSENTTPKHSSSAIEISSSTRADDSKQSISTLSSPSLIKEVETIAKPSVTIDIQPNSACEFSPPLIQTPLKPPPMIFSTPGIQLYSPSICRSASENFSSSRSPVSPSQSLELSMSLNLSSGSVSPVSPIPLNDTNDKVQEIKREREEQTEVVRRLVLERLGSGPRVPRKASRRHKVSPVMNVPPPVPPPPELPPPPPRPAPPLPVTPSFSDPELARERRSKSIIWSLSSYIHRRLGPRNKWASEPDLMEHVSKQIKVLAESPARQLPRDAHKSCGALEQSPPPVPPPPARYCPPEPQRSPPTAGAPPDVDERDAMQLWFEARWARLMAQKRTREDPQEPTARRLARLERRLSRPLSAEQQAAAVAELVQVSAQREAHQALMAADRRRSTTSGTTD